MRPRIVFDRRDRGFDAVLVALEIDQADLLLVTAADAASRDAAVAIAPAGLLAHLDQALLRLGLRDVAEVRDT